MRVQPHGLISFDFRAGAAGLVRPVAAGYSVQYFLKAPFITSTADDE